MNSPRAGRAAQGRSHANARRGAILDSALRLVSWLDSYGFASQDAYDFWACPAGGRAKARYYAGRLGGRAAVAPFALLDAAVPGLRSVVWPRTRFPIADAHWVSGFVAMTEATGEDHWLTRAGIVMGELLDARSPGIDNYAWGYPFDWVTCFGTFSRGLPLITTIPYVYEALVAYQELSGDRGLLRVIENVASFASDGIPDTPTGSGASASAYTPLDDRKVVNASAYRGYLMVDAGTRFNRDEWISQGLEYLHFVLDSQRRDGSWLYAMDGRDAFIDNFHTCFVLKNLVKAASRLPSGPAASALTDAALAGYAFYTASLLDRNGLPIPFAQTQRPSLVRRELYDYAEGVNLALLMSSLVPEAEVTMWRLIDSLLADWQLADGHFVTRCTVFGANRVPYHRWAQSQTFNALCQVLARAV